MSQRPIVPDDYRIRSSVNGWTYDPNASSNGHVWYGPDNESSVTVHSSFERTRAVVADERVGGIGGQATLCENEYDSPSDFEERQAVEAESVVRSIEGAVDWMETMSADEWSHPEISESIFDAPPGYELEECFRGGRETIIYYQRDGSDECSRLAGKGEPDVYTRDTCPYLYVHTYNGSGNATVALAPWLCAHGPGSKYRELKEIVETPDGCGLERALVLAREWAIETQPAKSRAGQATDVEIESAEL